MSDATLDPSDIIASLVKGILKDRFPDGFVFDPIIVESRTDFDGEDYLHTHIVFEGDIKNLDPAKTLGISTMLWPHARKLGYPSIPIQSFVEKSEWMAVNR